MSHYPIHSDRELDPPDDGFFCRKCDEEITENAVYYHDGLCAECREDSDDESE